MINSIIKIYCRYFSRLGHNHVFFCKDYAIEFSNLKDEDWQNKHVSLHYENGNGVAYYPKRSNSFTKVNLLKKYFSGYYKIEDGKILEEKASKKDIRNFKKVILWFPLTAKIKG